ncbi:ABC transporter ATP-binding protein [Sporanaerobacter acetigenes]|uniref:Iron(III) transport system ATP-binding protein n=1 Tax=Sporanaerobacter acetigenes DSM 13106 TaxID=1123281 RepID=A0A1M5TAY3_9FIRM|nr:ABC transporter ATP-binding protein [Sporanaerobacter acetigenes]SHH47770.1 iron(III) transport system ATP-binding protein [Sporanaerobacter acetigenes DSM 13106]
MKILFENICKYYDNVKALDNINFSVDKGELIALLGPSGCGKTTLLRITAGLIPHNSGKILVDDKDISSLPPQKRNTALVFQNYALFPHMSVYENVAYGLKIRKMSNKEIDFLVEDMLERVNLKEYKHRKIQHLSGGQQQRVALARALIIKPELLLFDEPLSNLDEKLRTSMREEIKSIQKELGITSIYVTHDQEEALAIADRIVVMKDGKVQQIAKPYELYHKPLNSFVANFIGQANIFNLPIKRESFQYVELLGQQIEIPAEYKGKREIEVMIRPEEIYFEKGGVEAIVEKVSNLGNILRYTLSVQEYDKIIVDSLNRFTSKTYSIGEKVYIKFNKEGIHLIPAE